MSNKRLITLTFLLTTLTLSELFSQTVNGVPISEIETDYIQVIAMSTNMNSRALVSLDFGQRNKAFVSLKEKDNIVLDENGEKLTNSVIDALNLFSRNGYEVITSHAVVVERAVANIYLMKRNVE